MSSVTLQVDLPQYSHSFSVHIKSTDTINDVKQEIARSCPGSPRSEGQRLIWKGRVLADSEQVSEVWQASPHYTFKYIARVQHIIRIRTSFVLFN